MHDPINQVGFLVQLAYFRASGKFFTSDSFKKVDLKYACELLELKNINIDKIVANYNAKRKSIHKAYILELCGWHKFNEQCVEKLHTELLSHAKQQMHPKSLLSIATGYLITYKIELPPYYVFANIISNVYNEIENQLVKIVDDSLTTNQKDILDDLIWIDDKRKKTHKYSALSRIKQFSYSTKIKDIEESIKNYKLLKAFTKTFESIYRQLDLSETATTYYSEWVSKSKLFQLKQFKNRSKAYLYLLAHLKHQHFRQTDLYIDTIIKLVGNTCSFMNRALEKYNIRILQEQKETFGVLAKSYKGSNQAFKQILTILDDPTKNKHVKNQEIRVLVLKQLNDEDIQLVDDDFISKILDKNFAAKELKTKLLKNMGLSLQKKLNPIIGELDFEKPANGSKTFQAIQQYVNNNGSINKNDVNNFLTEQEIMLVTNSGTVSISIYKGILFKKIYHAIKSGELCLRYSYSYLPINKYFIDYNKWKEHSKEILELNGISSFYSFNNVIEALKEVVTKKYNDVNEDYNKGHNKYLSFKKSGKFVISTPKSKNNEGKSKLAAIFSKGGIIPIPDLLNKINEVTGFGKSFKHHAIKKVIMKPTPETIFAGIISKGCNHGAIRMANISKGIDKTSLSNTINWFFNLENIQEANNIIIEYINKLALPDIYKLNHDGSHTSSDGQKFNVGVDSILANYSFKYFGQSQGISVYTFIDDRQVLFYNTILSPGVREAAFVIDGLLENNSIKSYIHSTDTHGFSEVIFAVMHFLGVSFAPRIKKLGSQVLYCIDSKKAYKNNGYKISPNKKINIKLIEEYWDDILRLIATIKSKTVTASKIFARLNSYTKELPLYRALKEFGRIIKTIYILTYVDDVSLRKQIEKQLNKIELSNKFAKAVFFANCQEFRVGSTMEQKIIVACKGFIQNCIILWNYLYLSKTLLESSSKEEQKALVQIIKASSVISWQHINLHGEYDFESINNNARTNIVFDWDKISRLKVA